MAKVGIYDSGVGGLNVLKRVLDSFIGNDVLYFADDLSCPLGLKSDEEVRKALKYGLSRLFRECEVVAIACNTASSVYKGGEAIRLLPPERGDENTLLLATQGTLRHFASGYQNVGDTPELATLIERQAEKCFLKGKLDMAELLPYLSERLSGYKDIKRVVLGCSHYPFVLRELRKIFPYAEFSDGIDEVISALAERIKPIPKAISKIDFVFSGKDESAKYRFILSELMNRNFLL